MKIFFVLNIIICNVMSLKISFQDNNTIGIVVNEIVLKYFSHLQCICVITEKRNSYLLQDLKLPPFISSFHLVIEEELNTVYSVYNIKNMLKTTFEQAGVGFVVQLSKPNSFLNTWKDVAKTALHRYNPRMLLLPTSANNNISGEILGRKITEFLVDMTIVDLVAPEGSNQTFEFVTTNWDVTKKVLATCQVSDCLNLEGILFSNKISDLQNKELKVATFTYLPYALIDPLDGTEMRIAVEYCRIHNCSISIVTDHAQWGQIHENGTGDGILGNVAEERADVGLGALYLWYHEYQFLDYSTPYIRTGITCLAPKPELLSALLLFVRPFTLLTWIIVICILCIAVASLFFIKKLDTFIKRGYDKALQRKKRHNTWFTTKADTILRTFGFLVMQASSNQLIEVHSIRHLVNWLHVMFLLITTSYNSGLASIFTVPPYLPPIDSVSDLARSGLGWGATHDAWIFSLREATEPEMKILVNRFKSLPGPQLHSLSLKGDFAFSVERLPAGHFAIGDYITVDSMKHLRLMKEDIYFEQCTIVFQKGSPFTNSFNQLIHRLLGSGLLLFWEGEVARKYLHSNIQSAVRDSTMDLYQPRYNALLLVHVQGAFFLLVAGLSMALLAFLGEIYMGRMKTRGATREKSLKGIKKTVRFSLYPEKDTSQYGFFF